MEAHDLLDTYGIIIEFPDLTVSVSDEPVVGASDHGDDVGRAVVGRVDHDLLFDGGDSDLKEIAGLSVVDVLELPPPDIPVATRGDKQLFLLIENNDLDETLVEGGFRLLVEDQVRFHQVTVPKNEGSVLGTAEDLAVGELADAGDVGKFELAEFSDFSLELQTGEGLRHFPKTDVTGAASEQDIVCEGRESHLVHLLREGLSFQNNFFVDPLPHSDGEVGVATDTRQFEAGAGELNVRIQIFRTVS